MMNRELKAYIELMKPNILNLVLVSTALGYFLAEQGINDWNRFIWTLVGAGLTCGGSGALNHYLERHEDKMMKRTCRRPIPQGIIKPEDAFLFGMFLVMFGITILCAQTNLLTAFLSLLTAFLYILVYTPLKKISWVNTPIGAIPGAIPPLGGWAAAKGVVEPGAWVLFAILYFWQFPHFYAIAWMSKDDYKKAGFKMLPVVHPDGKFMFQQTLLFTLFLIPSTLMLSWLGYTGLLFAVGAGMIGIGMMYFSIQFQITKSAIQARQLLISTVFYLPILFGLLMADLYF